MLGVGWRWSLVVMAVAWLGGASACSAGGAGAKADGQAASAERASQPEQVVQKMIGTDVAGARTAEGEGAVVGESRASAAVVSRSKAGSLAPRANSVETISSKHLEAELNRLEAELAN